MPLNRRLFRDRTPRARGGALLRSLWAAACLLLAACAAVAPVVTPTPPADVTISITVDGDTRPHTLPSNLTVREALARAGIAVGELDKLSPPAYTRLAEGLAIAVTRVAETFETDQAVLPFASQTVKNEGLPAGERRLLQAGANGLEEITYRTVFEDGVQVSRSIVKRVVLRAPMPEIILIGSQASFTIVPISGTLAYLNGQNAWLMRENTGQRRPLTFSGDLDGRIFDLSPDGQWLLFTRAVTDSASAQFNTLWAISATAALTNPQPIDLQVGNVQYAEWSPIEPRTFAYSTAEKISRPPGWQANNDLWLKTWDERRNRLGVDLVFTATQILDASSGGVYGWWGTGFAFAPDGSAIAYARTDSVGVINLASQNQNELVRFTAYNSRSDWAWYPTVRWSPRGRFLYTVLHGPPVGLEAPEDSPVFDLTAIAPTGSQYNLLPHAGMFANPLPSPVMASATAEQPFRVGFLQAGDPNNSPFSRYRLGIMDRDGSNMRLIFPPADLPGLAANARFAWAPDGRLLAAIYEGNLWLINPDTGITQQLTGDGLSDHPAWAR